MEIRNLNGIPIEEIVSSMLEAFEGYFVKMPESVAFWKNRYHAARVDWNLSFGVFDEKKIVAFIINGIDFKNNKLTAFNTGTGVIEAYRGNQWVDKLYEFAIPKLKERRIEQCQLEVIQENKRAVRVYERIGFAITKKLNGYTGDIVSQNLNVNIEPVSLKEIAKKFPFPKSSYSWDHVDAALERAGAIYTHYVVVKNTGRVIGYFSIKPESGYLAQFEYVENNFPFLLEGIHQVQSQVRIVNVDASEEQRIQHLLDFDFENTINQYEMERSLN